MPFFVSFQFSIPSSTFREQVWRKAISLVPDQYVHVEKTSDDTKATAGCEVPFEAAATAMHVNL
jgi:hypothetical protein